MEGMASEVMRLPMQVLTSGLQTARMRHGNKSSLDTRLLVSRTTNVGEMLEATMNACPTSSPLRPASLIRLRSLLKHNCHLQAWPCQTQFPRYQPKQRCPPAPEWRIECLLGCNSEGHWHIRCTRRMYWQVLSWPIDKASPTCGRTSRRKRARATEQDFFAGMLPWRC